MNLPCDVVMDLVGLYKDGLASKESKAAVDEHLKSCPDCRKYYKMYDSIEKSTKNQPEPVLDMDSYFDYNYSDVSKRLRKTHNRKLLIMSAIAGTAVVLTAVNLAKMLNKNK